MSAISKNAKVVVASNRAAVGVYEDTTGLRPGIEVQGTGELLGIRLGPGLLGGIFDGLLRPLAGTKSPYVAPGMSTARSASFRFTPRLRTGERVSAGAVCGDVRADTGRPQVILVPPNVEGEVVAIAKEGVYADDATVCALRGADGRAHRGDYLSLTRGSDREAHTARAGAARCRLHPGPH